MGHRYLLGQASAEGVGTGNDDAVINTQFEECVTAGVDLGQEIGMGNRYLAVLVATLLLVRYLVLDLQAAGTCFNHLLGQQVSGFRITKAGVDVGNDGHHVRFKTVDFTQNLSLFCRITGFAGRIQCAEQATQNTGVSLAQEGVQLFDQFRNRCFFMHGLIWQRAKFRTQGRYHPTGQVQVPLLGRAKVFLDGYHFLLTDKTMPATQGLGVEGWIGIVFRHILTHYVGGVLRNFQPGSKSILGAHTSSRFGIDGIPGAAGRFTYTLQRGDVVRVF